MPKEFKKATKDKIFKTAAELFSREGYYKVSVREICESAGVTKPVLYYYYGDKENLLFEMMKETRELVERSSRKYIDREAKFEEQLEGIIRFYTDFVEEYPHLLKFLAFVQFTAVPDKVRRYKCENAKNDWAYVNKLFQEAQMKGNLNPNLDIKIAVRSFIGSLISILSDYLMENIKKEEFNSELYSVLAFWKSQFIID
jgi:AcrR family transcriptional regulator